MGKQITITVIDGGAPLLSNAPSRSNERSDRIFGYGTLMLRAMAIYVMVALRILLLDPSPFDNHTVFMISSFVAFSFVGFVCHFMMMEHKDPAEGTNYTFLKFMGSYSAFLALFSLLVVLVLPPEFNWIGYLAAWVMFGILVTCFYLDDQQDIGPPIFSDLIHCILMIIPFWTYAPFHLNVILRTLQVTLWLEIASHLITYLRFIYVKTRKIQQDESTDNFPSSGVSYMMPLGSTSC